MTDDQKSIVAFIRGYARDHYNEGGWDILVECWEDADIVKFMGDAKSIDEALRQITPILKANDDYRSDIQRW
jgi:hypothetical protein